MSVLGLSCDTIVNRYTLLVIGVRVPVKHLEFRGTRMNVYWWDVGVMAPRVPSLRVFDNFYILPRLYLVSQDPQFNKNFTCTLRRKKNSILR